VRNLGRELTSGLKRVLKARDLLLALYKHLEKKEHLLIVIVVVVVTVCLVRKEKSCVFVKRQHFSTTPTLVQIWASTTLSATTSLYDQIFKISY
jgi:hypothetical protein